MADSFILTDGIFSIELLYNSASQAEYKILYGAQIQVDQPDVLMHQPDFGEPVPVRGINQDRTAFFNLHLPPNTDWDTVLNSVSVVKRAVDGADSQALRYWTDGDVNRVVLRIQLNGATNYTDIPVKFGVVDDSGSYYSPVAILNEMASNVGVILTVAPLGEGASFTLQNDMASTPHFIEDSNSDGLADNWTESGTPTTTIDTTNYLIGGKSQKVVGAGAGDGVFHPPISITTTCGASIWVYLVSGTLTIKLRNTTGGLDIESSTVTTANIADDANVDKTAVDKAGATWYRFDLSGSLVGTQSVRFEAALTGAGEFFLDGAYIQSGATVSPDGWCSTASLKNRYDPDVAITNINYLDFWGIPGDADATFILESSGMTNEAKRIIGARRTGLNESASATHWRSAENFTETTGWNRVPDAALAGGYYISSNAPNATSTPTSFTIFNTPCRLYCSFYATVSTTTCTASYTLMGQTVTLSTVTTPTTSAYNLIDLGLINTSGIFEPDNTTGRTIQVDITVGGVSGTARLNGIYLIPTSGGFAYISGAEGDTKYYSRDNKAYETTADESLGVVGSMPVLQNGSKGDRLIVLLAGGTSDQLYTPTRSSTVTSTITPRSRHLLGVQ